MSDSFNIISSLEYGMGADHYSWGLLVTIYQRRDTYYCEISDVSEVSPIITSSKVAPSTMNDLEDIIYEIIDRSQGMENIDDFYEALKKSFYGGLFTMKEEGEE